MTTNELSLGKLDVCLNVKDINKSLAFYEELGFRKENGDAAQGYMIVVNGNARLGLFQGHISRNMLNFRGEDVFALAAELKKRGIKLKTDAEREKDGSVGAM